ncbi:hypothetical protein ABPG72_013814 [Tetrahymena utriculariae]
MDQSYLQRLAQEEPHAENNPISILENDFMQTLYDNQPKNLTNNIPFQVNQHFGLMTGEGNPFTTNFNLGAQYNTINQQNSQNPLNLGLNFAGSNNTNQFGASFLNQNNSGNGSQQDDFNRYIANTSFLDAGDYMNANIQIIKKSKGNSIKNNNQQKTQEDKKLANSRQNSISEVANPANGSLNDVQKLKLEKSQSQQNNLNSSINSNNSNNTNNNSNNINNSNNTNNAANNNNNNANGNSSSLKHTTKNTYINKINSLITDQEQLKRESQFIQTLQKEQQFSDVILKDQRMQESVRIRQQQIQQTKDQVSPVPAPNPITTTNKSQSSTDAIQKENDQYALYSQQDKGSESSSSNQNGSNKNYEKKLNEKLVRNRESARNSRKRKKIYIELLETKVANLNEELEKTKRALESNNQYLNKMSFQTQLAGLNLNQTQLLDKLEKCIQSNGEENEINLLLDSLRFRLGATGKERITAINYFFKQILDICIPTHFRYLLYTADAEEDMFADNPFSPEQINKRPDWRKELIQYVDINDSQRQKILKFKKKFKQEKKNLDDLIINLQQIKKSIQEKTYSLEHMVDSLRNYMNPMQSAKFLSFMERNRYRKEISNTSLWQALKAQDQEGDDYEDDNVSQNNDPNSQLQFLCQQTQQQLYFQQQYNQPQLGFNSSGFLGDFQNPYGPPASSGFQNQFYGGMPNPSNLMANGHAPTSNNPQFSSQNSAFNYHQNQQQNGMNGNNILHQGMMQQSLSDFSTKIETGSLPRKKLKSNNSMSQDNM